MDTLTRTSWQRRHLERQLRSTRDAHVYRRTLAVLEVAQGESVVAVALRLRVTLRAVYPWVATYGRDHVPDALADRDQSGRPCLLTPSDRERLRELLGRSPQERGYFAAQWTVPLLREHLTRRTGRAGLRRHSPTRVAAAEEPPGRSERRPVGLFRHANGVLMSGTLGSLLSPSK